MVLTLQIKRNAKLYCVLLFISVNNRTCLPTFRGGREIKTTQFGGKLLWHVQMAEALPSMRNIKEYFFSQSLVLIFSLIITLDKK